MDAVNELVSFITQKENNGALLFTGEWGCGKTHLIKKMAETQNREGKFAVVIISLFGVDSVDALHRKVKEITFHSISADYSGLKKLYKNTSSFLSKATAPFKEVSQYAKGINAAISVGLYEFVQIEKEIKHTVNKQEVTRKLVLVFDDFERCSLSTVDLIGAINQYCETKEIKTILVANENMINSDDYKEYKEKLVWRTVKALPNFSRIIEEIVSQYPETCEGYNGFLKQNNKLVTRLFLDSETNNLRSLKSILMNFERIYEALKQINAPEQCIPKFLYTFGAMSFEHKAGKYEKGEFGYLFANQKIWDKYCECDSRVISLIELQEWATEGRWDYDAFCSSAQLLYAIDSLSVDQAFLLTPFWDLDQKTINEGMPIIIDFAYEGKLTRDNLIELMKKVKAINDNGFDIPCNIDYVKAEKGFALRKSRIRRGDEVEPKRHTSAELKEIDNEAKELYKAVENLENYLFEWENRRKFIEYLKNLGAVTRYELRDKYLDYFDEELLQEVIKAYEMGNNSRKRDIALTIKGFYFMKQGITNDFETKVSIKNFNTLKQKLEIMSTIEKDQITKAISKNFIKWIEDTMLLLKNSLA